MTTLGSISLLSPVMLGGLALVALPIAAHLLHRRARRRVVFPSVVLLAQTKASQSQMFRLRRLLLLAVRCGAVALLALAFAQPLWETGVQAAGEREEDAVTVLVLDASASMAQRSGGVTAFEALRAAGARALDDAASAGDSVNLIVADGRPRAAFPRATRNIEAVRREIERCTVSDDRADLAGALAEAGAVMAEHGGRRRLFLASDLQATNWADVAAALTASPLPLGTEVALIPPTGDAETNLAIVGVRSRPTEALVGRRVELVVSVANYGDRDAVARPRAVIGETERAAAKVLVEPWQTREVVLGLTLEDAGDHRLRPELAGADALEADNLRWQVLHASATRTVALVADDDAADAGTGTYYLQRALAPGGAGRDGVAVELVRSGELDDAALAGVSGVFVGHTGGLSDAAAAALGRYARAGGGVVVFGAGGPVDRTLDALHRVEGGVASPWRVAGLRDADERPALTIVDGDWEAPLLRAFDERSREALAQARFTRAWTIGEVRPEARVLLWFDDGTPALAEQPVGRGRVVVANFGADPLTGDLAKHGCFVALVQSLFEELQPTDRTAPDARVGQPLAFSLAKDAASPGITLFGPKDQPLGVFDVSVGDAAVTLSLPRAGEAGFYEARAGDRVLAVRAVNLDPRESDLRRVDPAVARAMLMAGGASATIASNDGSDGVALEAQRPLWGWMLAGALALLAVEMGLLSYWRR